MCGAGLAAVCVCGARRPCVGGAMSLEKFLENLSDPSISLGNSDFIEISDLSPAELGVFARAWFSLSLDRKRAIMRLMVELAEDSPELDFCTIFKMCLKDEDESVLEKAIDGLWEYEDRSVLPGLLHVLDSDKGSEVRAAAASALGKFSLLAQEGNLLARDAGAIQDGLMAVLQDPDEDVEVRRRSLEAVAPFNTPDIRDYVCWAYGSEDLRLKSSAIFAMGRTGEMSWLPTLIRELDSVEPSLRYESANACGDLGEEDIVPDLIGLLEDDDYQVQVAALNALGKIGGPLAKRALQCCIQEGDASLEEAARNALENVEFLEDPMAFSAEV